MTTITVIGAGAIGTIVAARLGLDAGNRVTVAVRTPITRLAVRSDDGSLEATPAVILDRSEGRPSDWVLVATKAYDAESAATWFAAVVGEQTRVAVLQNGVEHVARFQGYVDAGRVVPVVVDLPATRAGAGRVVQHGRGRLTVPLSVNGAAFAELFAHSGLDVVATEDFVTAAWEKLCVNSVGALTAATLAPSLRPENPATEQLVRALVGETAAVARADGAAIDASVEERIIRGILTAPLGSNSLAEDRRTGGRMEIDARNGAVVRIGERHGVPTPVNRVIVDLLRSVDRSSPRSLATDTPQR